MQRVQSRFGISRIATLIWLLTLDALSIGVLEGLVHLAASVQLMRTTYTL